MASQRASVTPLALFLKPPVPNWEAGCSAERAWEAAEGEAAQGAGKGKGRGCEEARGAPVRLQEQASSSHSLFRPFFWGIHIEWKWQVGKAKLLLWLRASTRSCRSPHAANKQSAQQQCTGSNAQAAAARRGELYHSKLNSRQNPLKLLSNSKINPHLLKQKNYYFKTLVAQLWLRTYITLFLLKNKWCLSRHVPTAILSTLV